MVKGQQTKKCKEYTQIVKCDWIKYVNSIDIILYNYLYMPQSVCDSMTRKETWSQKEEEEEKDCSNGA